jgi:hypothetical protein
MKSERERECVCVRERQRERKIERGSNNATAKTTFVKSFVVETRGLKI